MNQIKPSEQSIQPGRIVKITHEPPRARRYGFILGSEHVIQPAPANGVNSYAGVWVKDKNGKLFWLHFPYWCTTAKKVDKVIRKRRNK
jgi:hypothetical protein